MNPNKKPSEITQVDIAIIGGGINGAALAAQAAQSGLSVALFEKNDFASGTSSKSTKLLHGGIRYLEQARFPLVFEGLHERYRLLHMAPHLAHPIPFLLPSYKGDQRPAWMLKIGLWLYDLLAGTKKIGRHRWFSPAEALAKAPALKKEGLTDRNILPQPPRSRDDALDHLRLRRRITRAVAVGLALSRQGIHRAVRRHRRPLRLLQRAGANRRAADCRLLAGPADCARYCARQYRAVFCRIGFLVNRELRHRRPDHTRIDLVLALGRPGLCRRRLVRYATVRPRQRGAVSRDLLRFDRRRRDLRPARAGRYSALTSLP